MHSNHTHLDDMNIECCQDRANNGCKISLTLFLTGKDREDTD